MRVHSSFVIVKTWKPLQCPSTGDWTICTFCMIPLVRFSRKSKLVYRDGFSSVTWELVGKGPGVEPGSVEIWEVMLIILIEVKFSCCMHSLKANKLYTFNMCSLVYFSYILIKLQNYLATDMFLFTNLGSVIFVFSLWINSQNLSIPVIPPSKRFFSYFLLVQKCIFDSFLNFVFKAK